MHVSSRARRYAKALARVAAERDVEERVQSELEGLGQYFADQPVARLTLESPATSVARKSELLKAVAGAHDFAEPTLNALRLLVENRCFAMLPEIVEGFGQQVRERSSVVQATVTTAQPLDDDQVAKLREVLREVAGGRDVDLQVEEDPSLVAGAITRVGSVVYDGSLEHQLGRLRQQLIAE